MEDIKDILNICDSLSIADESCKSAQIASEWNAKIHEIDTEYKKAEEALSDKAKYASDSEKPTFEKLSNRLEEVYGQRLKAKKMSELNQIKKTICHIGCLCGCKASAPEPTFKAAVASMINASAELQAAIESMYNSIINGDGDFEYELTNLENTVYYMAFEQMISKDPDEDRFYDRDAAHSKARNIIKEFLSKLEAAKRSGEALVKKVKDAKFDFVLAGVNLKALFVESAIEKLKRCISILEPLEGPDDLAFAKSDDQIKKIIDDCKTKKDEAIKEHINIYKQVEIDYNKAKKKYPDKKEDTPTKKSLKDRLFKSRAAVASMVNPAFANTDEEEFNRAFESLINYYTDKIDNVENYLDEEEAPIPNSEITFESFVLGLVDHLDLIYEMAYEDFYTYDGVASTDNIDLLGEEEVDFGMEAIFTGKQKAERAKLEKDRELEKESRKVEKEKRYSELAKEMAKKDIDDKKKKIDEYISSLNTLVFHNQQLEKAIEKAKQNFSTTKLKKNLANGKYYSKMYAMTPIARLKDLKNKIIDRFNSCKNYKELEETTDDLMMNAGKVYMVAKKTMEDIHEKLLKNKSVAIEYGKQESNLEEAWDEAKKENAKRSSESSSKGKYKPYDEKQYARDRAEYIRKNRQAYKPAAAGYSLPNLDTCTEEEFNVAIEAMYAESYADMGIDKLEGDMLISALESIITYETFDDDAELFEECFANKYDELAAEGFFANAHSTISKTLDGLKTDIASTDAFSVLMLLITKLIAFLEASMITLKNESIYAEMGDELSDSLDVIADLLKDVKFVTAITNFKNIDEKYLKALNNLIEKQNKRLGDVTNEKILKDFDESNKVDLYDRNQTLKLVTKVRVTLNSLKEFKNSLAKFVKESFKVNATAAVNAQNALQPVVEILAKYTTNVMRYYKAAILPKNNPVLTTVPVDLSGEVIA